MCVISCNNETDYSNGIAIKRSKKKDFINLSRRGTKREIQTRFFVYGAAL